MLSNLEFATFAVYSPRGVSEKAITSRSLRGRIKNGDPKVSIRTSEIIKEIPELMTFFEDNAILIPVPRSSPLKEGNLWPTKVIASEMVKSGLGLKVSTCLHRFKSVPKSSFQSGGDNRPSIQMHYDSLKVDFEYLESNTLILIDDIITLGRTTMACASRLKDIFPNANIKAFGLMRTRSFEDDNIIRDPRVGEMQYNSHTGKVKMPD